MKATVLVLGLVTIVRSSESSDWVPIAGPESADAERPQRSLDPSENTVNQVNPAHITNNHVPTTYSEHVNPVYVQQPVPYPVKTPVHVPYEVPVKVPNPVPVEVKVPVPYVKNVAVPYDKPVPYPIVKDVPVPIVKDVQVAVEQPYPVPYLVYKTKIVDHGTKHTFEGFGNFKHWLSSLLSWF